MKEQRLEAPLQFFMDRSVGETGNHEAQAITGCRLCGGPLGSVALSLGDQPISNRLPRTREEAHGLPRYPLDVAICQNCGLAQLAHHLDADQHFHDDYTYLASASSTWHDHCARYAERFADDYHVKPGELIVEVGSNDGAMLKALQAHDHRVLGVEPAGNIADIANQAGVPTINAFFNAETAAAIMAKHGPAKCIIGNKALAHVPDTHDFLIAARDLLAEDGFFSFEFPHYVNILEKRYFDTVYHEHYTYLGVDPLEAWARRNGMAIVDIEHQPTQGGSLRVLIRRANRETPTPQIVTKIIAEEQAVGGNEAWIALGDWLQTWREEFRAMIAAQRAAGRKVAGYAAASKATVLLNTLGLTNGDVGYCCDASPIKQGRLIPGADIDIRPPEALKSDPPDVIIVFAWNIFDEIANVLRSIIEKPVDVICPLPEIKILRLAPGSSQ